MKYCPSARYFVRYHKYRELMVQKVPTVKSENIVIIPLVFGVKGFISSNTMKNCYSHR